MKAISVPINWLNEINGLTVADAIVYLRTLPPDHALNYWQSGGDDQGVEISSNLIHHRPYTEQELAKLDAMRKAKQIQDIKRSITYYEKQAAYWDGHDNRRAGSYRLNAELCRQRLKELT